MIPLYQKLAVAHKARQGVRIDVPDGCVLRSKVPNGLFVDTDAGSGLIEVGAEPRLLARYALSQVFPIEYWAVERAQARLDAMVIESLMAEAFPNLWPEICRVAAEKQLAIEAIYDYFREQIADDMRQKYLRGCRDPEQRRRLFPSMQWAIPCAAARWRHKQELGSN